MTNALAAPQVSENAAEFDFDGTVLFDDGFRIPSLPSLLSSALSFNAIIDPEILINCYRQCAKKGNAPGPDGLTYADFGPSERGDVCRKTSEQLRAGTWRPSEHRVVHILRVDGQYRELRLRNVMSRVVSTAVAAAVSQYLRPLNLPCVYSLAGQSTWAVFQALERAVREDGLFIFGQDDIRRAFDNLRVDDCVADYARHIRDPRLLGLAEKILHGSSHQPNRIGIAQGDPLSSNTMNLRLVHVLDSATPVRDPVCPLHLRYADNLAYLGRSVFSVEAKRSQEREYLANAGLELKQESGPPIDLREATTVLLGMEMTAPQSQLEFCPPPTALSALTESLIEAYEAADIRDTARSKLRGWISAYGPAWRNEAIPQHVSRIRRAIREAGFIGLVTSSDIRRLMAGANERWQRLCEKNSRAAPWWRATGPT